MDHKKIVNEVVEILGASISGSPNEISQVGKWLLALFSFICIPLSFAAITLIESGILIYIGEGSIESWVLWCLSTLPIIGLLLFKPVWNNQIGGTGFFVLLVKMLIVLAWIASVLFIASHFIVSPGTGVEPTDIKLVIDGEEISFNLMRSFVLLGLASLITLAPLVISDRIFPSLRKIEIQNDTSIESSSLDKAST